ncbi:MAG: DUF4249 family protein [Rhodothermales bacterium]|nr:DUF4249 family protein [Rhodothermales bacterium]
MRAVLTIIALLSLWGCDNTIVPLVPGSEGHLYVYGYFDTAADTQYVRLDAVRTSALGERERLADLEVVSFDGSGAATAWSHTTVQLDDGRDGDVYMAPFRPRAGETYTLTASQSDGTASTEAVVTMPGLPTLEPQRPRGDTLTLFQTVRVAGLERDPLRLTVLYDVQGFGADEPIQFPVDYGATGSLTPGGWDLDVFLKRDHTTVVAHVNPDGSARDITLLSIGMRTELLSPEWDDPDNVQNITGGRGFLGAIGRYELTWRLESAAVETLGFLDGQ